MLICRAIGGRGNRFGLDGMWMYVECVCGYEQVRYRTVEGDWRVGDVSTVRVLLSRPNAVCVCGTILM